ncbi:calcitonin gene-related peptide type 1 receptor-like isoform X1 [Mobula hypostoma]|uniref:calcitonin gene-related peptide type 1 receptor-like isoform X1 n=2 Tax=Mobula hypostoma TaxID=723540 RepID=UPI002FC2B25C
MRDLNSVLGECSAPGVMRCVECWRGPLVLPLPQSVCMSSSLLSFLLSVHSTIQNMRGGVIICFLMATILTELACWEHSTVQPNRETMASLLPSLTESRSIIMSAQYKCYLKIIRDPPYKMKGSYCSRTWDGWLCWEDAPAKSTSVQHCPNYFQDFDYTEKVTKICTEKGRWFQHPESNRTWSNYTQCTAYTEGKQMTATILYYVAITGHGISILCLLIALCIFFHYKSLSCQRISLHKSLFVSYLLNSIITLIWLSAVANNKELVERNPVGCRILLFVHLYLIGCNYFWMLCEGVYLHTLIIVAAFVEEQNLFWYYVLGWGFPLIPAIIHAIARSMYYNDNCWMSSDTVLLYIVHGPVCAALLVNLFFLLNIVRVLITKLRVTHHVQSKVYMKVVRATLILVPLMGIQFILIPSRPEGHLIRKIYDHVIHVFAHYQGLLVTLIFCFFNGEVQVALKKHWSKYRDQSNHQFNNLDGSHSNATSMSEITRNSLAQSISNHRTNGKSWCETIPLKEIGNPV